MIAQAIPAIVVGPVAGVFVDRTNKRRMLVIMNIIQAALNVAHSLRDERRADLHDRGGAFRGAAVFQPGAPRAPCQKSSVPRISRERTRSVC